MVCVTEWMARGPYLGGTVELDVWIWNALCLAEKQMLGLANGFTGTKSTEGCICTIWQAMWYSIVRAVLEIQPSGSRAAHSVTHKHRIKTQNGPTTRGTMSPCGEKRQCIAYSQLFKFWIDLAVLSPPDLSFIAISACVCPFESWSFDNYDHDGHILAERAELHPRSLSGPSPLHLLSRGLPVALLAGNNY